MLILRDIILSATEINLPYVSGASSTRISEDSASKILFQIATTNTDDDEIQSRLGALRATYEKANAGEPITGGPTLVELISRIKGYPSEEASRIVASILWRDDI